MKYLKAAVLWMILFASALWACSIFDKMEEKETSAQSRRRIANIDFCGKLTSDRDRFPCMVKFYLEEK